MEWRNIYGVVDMSSFMLFESTGDSEADSDLNMASSSDEYMEVNYEVDDAQSCCSDSSESFQDYGINHLKEYVQCPKKYDQEYDGYSPNYRDHYIGYVDEEQEQEQDDDDDDDDDVDDDGAIDQDSHSGEVGFVFSRKQRKKKRCENHYVDSRMEPVKKEDKDKLFWETCLAS